MAAARFRVCVYIEMCLCVCIYIFVCVGQPWSTQQWHVYIYMYVCIYIYMCVYGTGEKKRSEMMAGDQG